MIAFYEELEKSFSKMEKLFREEDMIEFSKRGYYELYLYHFGLGLWIRNNLLKENDKLYNCFFNCGIGQKDDMSDLMIHLFYIYIRTKYK